MAKYKIDAGVDYAAGYLRYGHYEGEIEIPDDKVDDDDYVYELIREKCNFVIDSYEIDEIGPISDIYMTKVIE